MGLAVAAAPAGPGAVSVAFGGLWRFYGDQEDVIFVRAESDALRRLNGRPAGVPHQEADWWYEPHLTLGTVPRQRWDSPDPVGAAIAKAGPNPLEGQTVTWDAVTWVSANRESRAAISLTTPPNWPANGTLSWTLVSDNRTYAYPTIGSAGGTVVIPTVTIQGQTPMPMPPSEPCDCECHDPSTDCECECHDVEDEEDAAKTPCAACAACPRTVAAEDRVCAKCGDPWLYDATF